MKYFPLVNRLSAISPNKDELRMTLASGASNQISLNTPIVTNCSHLENADGVVTAMTLFPIPGRYHAASTLRIRSSEVFPIESKNIIKNHREIIISEFDWKKADKIQDFVEENGAITFIIEDTQAQSKFCNEMKKFNSLYNHIAFIEHRAGRYQKPEKVDDLLFIVMTIYDLPYAIPVFNYKCCRGIGVSVKYVWKDRVETAHDPSVHNELYFVCNDYIENLFEADCVAFKRSAGLSSDYVDHFRNIVEGEARRRKSIPEQLKKIEKLKKQLSEQKAKEEGDKRTAYKKAQDLYVNYGGNQYVITTGTDTSGTTTGSFSTSYFTTYSV